MGAEQKDTARKKIKAKPIRPVLIASEATISDYPLFLERLLVGLADESIPVALVCPSNFDVDSVVSGSVEIIQYPVLELPFMGHYNRKILAKKLAKFKPTVLHCLCESEALLARQLSRLLGLGYVLTVNSLQKRFFQYLISSRRCARILVPAESIASNLEEILGKLARRVVQVNMGTFVEEQSRSFRNVNQFASIMVGRNFDNAGYFEKLLGAVRHLAIDGQEFMLVIIGEGPAENQLRKLLDVLGLSEIVTIVPRLEPWRCILSAGDIFIRLGPNRAFDPLLLEAMSVGMAVAGCQGGVDDLIVDGATAAVFDPDDELSIYGSLQRLFGRRELARELAKGAQKYLRENHTVSKMVSDILQTYREVQNGQ
ncbi:MAG: glycosyltransferase family 4 protein [Planctomycetota bacterium]|jgi:glycosyltransferase involved in cell wall biosynthesis